MTHVEGYAGSATDTDGIAIDTVEIELSGRAAKTSVLQENTAVEGVVAHIADREVHVVEGARDNLCGSHKFGGVAVVLDTDGFDWVIVVIGGKLVVAVAAAAARSAGDTWIDRIDGHCNAVGSGIGDG